MPRQTTQFKKGQSGNPGGRPQGLERYSRELVGDDGKKLADFWLDVMEDEDVDLKTRLDASKLLAERGFGRPAQLIDFQGPDGEPITVILHLNEAKKPKRA